ncbi:hypothetical protein KJ656_10630 [bacterium]|nr:hypothetical protein [bacterium]
MNSILREKIADMKQFLLVHSGLIKYLNENKNDKDKIRRTFNLFRSDLMRLTPETAPNYFANDKLKIWDIESDPRIYEGKNSPSFLKDLADHYFNIDNTEVIKKNLEALIFACLEIDATLKFTQMSKILPEDDKRKLEKLNLWRLP